MLVPAWDPPEEFDDYRLIRALGGGSMGRVWLAEDAVLARHVAIKFTALPRLDAAVRQRFLIEARAAARVQHPNVVSIYRVGELGDRPYLVTEFVRGRPLSEVARPLDWERALAIAVDLARGLAAAHRQGVLHCDLKPANAVVGDDGTAKLLDFGLATLLRRGEGGVTEEAPTGRPGAGVSGTPAYLAPELWGGQPPTRRSDVYSLGAVLFELVSGKAPFADVPDAALGEAVRGRDAPSLPGATAAHARLAAVIARCLRRDPAERFATGEGLREALEQLARPAGGPVPEGNPYRGLRAFEADHRALFFGRGAEIGVLLDRLRADAFVLVAGDSGVGKSSLCRAGVLPAAAEGALGGGRAWTVATAVPGRHPLASLCAALAPILGQSEDALSRALREEPASLPRLVRRALGDGRGLLLFVDQLEELLTQALPAEAALVDEALGALASGAPGTRLVATLRADFLTRFAALPRLSEDLSRVLYFLRPLSRERLREVISGPALSAGARFESEAMVEELAAQAAAAEGGLPLLQFALAELWEARDPATSVITHAALEAAGGVAGALSRHGDSVLRALLPAQRAAARRLLSRLVTLEGTRARRTEEELGAQDPVNRSALDALVRGRLLVAQDAPEGSAFEVAHEVLVRGWPTLKAWLSEDAQLRVAREGLSRAAAEWQRLGRERAGLLARAQLDELARLGALGPADLTGAERALVAASRAAARRRKLQLVALAVALPALAFCVYLVTARAARDETRKLVAQHLAAGRSRLQEASGLSVKAGAQRREAYARFDGHARAQGEELWGLALKLTTDADRSFGAAGAELEAAVALAPSDGALRDQLAEALCQRARLADEAHWPARRDELERRCVLYDGGGAWTAALRRPASLAVESEPPGAAVVLEGEGPGGGDLALGSTPLAARPLPAGSHLLVLRHLERAPVRLPVFALRGEALELALPLPLPAAVPTGFLYVPAGRFLSGTAADEELRHFFDAAPLHPMSTGAYLIGRYEVTFGEWLVWLRTLPAAERARRLPGVQQSSSTTAVLRLEEVPGPAPRGGLFRLTLQPGEQALSALEGEQVRYPDRKEHAAGDWLRFPVTAVSADDAEAYASFLDDSGRLPGARLCTEPEWERAARGADGRAFPTGEELPAGGANLDLTHGRESLGPDEVGAHPQSRSPVGADDLAGNAFEFTRSGFVAGEYAVRGGSFFHDWSTANSANRSVMPRAWRDPSIGLRLCADLR